MGCPFALLAGLFPRLALFIYWVARPAKIDAAFDGFLLPLLGGRSSCGAGEISGSAADGPAGRAAPSGSARDDGVLHRPAGRVRFTRRG